MTATNSIIIILTRYRHGIKWDILLKDGILSFRKFYYQNFSTSIILSNKLYKIVLTILNIFIANRD